METAARTMAAIELRGHSGMTSDETSDATASGFSLGSSPVNPVGTQV